MSTQIAAPTRWPFAPLMRHSGCNSLYEFHQRTGLSIKAVEALNERGLTHKEADNLAVKCLGTLPELIWGWEWISDETAAYDPTPEAIQKFMGCRFEPGGLTHAILEIAEYHRGEPISPASVARELGRSKPTAVYVRMGRMAEQGLLEIYSVNPNRYWLPPQADTTDATTTTSTALPAAKDTGGALVQGSPRVFVRD